MRRHRVQQQLCQDHGVVLNPDTLSPFLSLEDAVSRLLPYHTCAGHLPGQAGFLTVDQQFDAVSGILLKRTKDMLNKYRQLLLGEAQQVSPSAEMVMLERLFLQAERGVLGEERRKARLDPDSFLLSLRKPASGPNNGAPSAPSSFLQAGSPLLPVLGSALQPAPGAEDVPLQQPGGAQTHHKARVGVAEGGAQLGLRLRPLRPLRPRAGLRRAADERGRGAERAGLGVMGRAPTPKPDTRSLPRARRPDDGRGGPAPQKQHRGRGGADSS
ncbi:hypothetical protein ANANG_G00024220 [Anguilla anguilla]|uniref:GLTSCR protein conserved domain-containing protein n=1 Tax=Anguilla anguilla TaxID=7936 RepID=A0A9D3SC91_ANGAN|nr:hypothetical protein ANANG_G00024220 [Anguilla anguilla]